MYVCVRGAGVICEVLFCILIFFSIIIIAKHFSILLGTPQKHNIHSLQGILTDECL